MTPTTHTTPCSGSPAPVHASTPVSPARLHRGNRGARLAIRLSVTDDGRGGATCAEGGGLAGLVDRVNALGGKFSLSSTPGAGTTIEATLPCG